MSIYTQLVKITGVLLECGSVHINNNSTGSNVDSCSHFICKITAKVNDAVSASVNSLFQRDIQVIKNLILWLTEHDAIFQTVQSGFELLSYSS